MVHISQCWTREVSCLVPGPVQQGQGAREPSTTSFFRRESSIASLCRDTKLYAGAEGFVGWRADMPWPHSTMFFWGGTELPGNTVCSTAFLSIVLIGTSSGNVLLIISSHLSHVFLGWCARLGPFTQKSCLWLWDGLMQFCHKALIQIRLSINGPWNMCP